MALAAIFVFLLVCAVHVLESMLDLAKKRGSVSDEQLKLRLEISQILKESSALSTPSTFAQAAKLKRLAAAKEKELSKMQQTDIKGKQSLHEKYGKVLMGTKVLVYGLLVLWFWSAPVTTVPKHLLQPFGRMFSWRGVDAATGRVVVGIMPWLFLTSRVSKLLSQKLAPIFLH
ncbi:protein GET1 [Hordeum vulgare subsp. vulgare]|uniref:Predicted protein n=1 Tax=Hordeum vulgare subsp. vulgare TaxID=112509 RepID=F2CV76_HORVV|nr:protein GET1 [Hordeum vulgare subsp. vulgare]KAI4976402.1 hypothetical protein ZWY2020_050009 [Hordeum vulgare]BAJ86747.1 predicted protein [Hordeum vulgare subsp. vulgare]